MNCKNILAFAAACTIAAGSVYAQTALPSIRVEQDPVSAGMGFSGLASTSGTAYSALRNSSVIPLSDRKMDFGASYQSWAPDGASSANMALGAAFKAGERFGFAIAGVLQNGAEYSITDETGNDAGSFGPSVMSVAAGFGVKIIDNLSVGANVRFASQKLTKDDSYSAFCGDVFLSYRFSGFNLSAGVSSLGSRIEAADGKSYSLPASARIGADWTKTFAETHTLKLDADLDYFFYGSVAAAVGAQYSFRDMVFVRAGYHYGPETAVLPSFASAGLGVKFFGVELNAAYLFASDILGGTMTFGLGYSF